MKRVNRISQNAVCIIPRQAITWLMLAMAAFTILFFISIEIKRIIWLKNIERKALLEYNNRITDEETSNNTSEGIYSFLKSQSNSTVAYDDEIPSADTQNLNTESLNDILSNDPLCSKRLFLLILVVSAPENFERRDAIRKWWPNTDMENKWISGIKTKTIFLIGRSSNRFLNVLLKHEADISEDILFGDYLDTYRNLTRKVVHGLTWVASHCKPSYVLKTDDDCFVNLPLLLHFLWRLNPIRDQLYAGRVRWSAPVVRDPNSRWYVSTSNFKAARFAPYVSGAGYVMSLDVLLKFAEVSSAVALFPNEDAFVGTVMKLARVKPTYSARFVTHSGTWQICNFLYLFVVHHVSPVRQREYRDLAMKAFEQCSRADMSVDWV